jgi:hypothetical protein
MKIMEWCGRKCELVNHVGEMIVEGRIIVFDSTEPVLDDDLGEINVGFTILNYPNDRSQIMSIWKRPLSQIILDGHSLFSLLTTSNKHHVSKEDEKIFVGVKKKITHF